MAPNYEQRQAPRERPSGSPVMYQRWSKLLFLHWEVPAQWLTPTLPAGLHLDTFEGRAYLGVVPFAMERVRPRFLPCVPGLSWFLELNLRTYVYDDLGRPGVWFYSLDANQPVAVELARKLFHLPYQHAQMTARQDKEFLDYSSRRKGGQETARYRYQGSGEVREAEAGSVEFFLLERYLLFSEHRRSGLKIGQVHHRPYPFQAAVCDGLSTLPFTWNQFTAPESPPVSALYSRGVDVEIFGLKSAQNAE